MKIYDISWPITVNMTAYKDKKMVQMNATKSFEADGVRDHSITMGTHTGTHLDAPAHFLDHGKTVNQIPLDQCIGACVVVDCTQVTGAIMAADLQHLDQIKHGDVVLLKTRNSNHGPCDLFDYSFVYLDVSGAQFLIKRGVKAVGIDYLGIERNDPHHATHTVLMQHDVIIYEGLRLADVAAGRYFFYGIPLALPGLEAAPVRAILIDV